MKPPLELTFAITGPGGRKFRIGPTAPKPGDRPLDFSFDTEAGEGFAAAGLSLRREYAGDYPDLDPLNDFQAIGADGQIGYEGRSQGPSRSIDQSGSQIRLDFQGWMSHARQRQWCDLGLDADPSQWQEPSQARRGVIRPVVSTLNTSVVPSAEGGISFNSESGQGVPAFAWAELDYTAPPSSICRGVYYKGSTANTTNFDFPYFAAGGSNYLMTLNSAFQTASFTTAAGLIAAIVRCNTAVTPAAGSEYKLDLSFAVPFGDHGLTAITRSDGRPGIALTDLLIWIFSKYAPKIDTSQVQRNTYPVAHAVWRDLIDTHEAAKGLNAFAQWAMGVWENHRLEHRPFDLSTADWQVQAGINGVEVENPGQTVDDAFNGAIVTYTDFTGSEQILTPNDASDLADTNPAIAANQWGEEAWIPIQLSGMRSRDDAVFIGRARLLEINRPKFPSTITLTGHVRNGKGQWQQGWLPRANQTIRITNHPNDLPRLITKTSWAGNKLTITTDNALNRMEAIQARTENARTAGGVS